MKEYELLRAEMIENQQEIAQYKGILYGVIAAILVFAFERDNYLLFLVPYFAIVPLYLMSQSSSHKICYLAAYMNVFLEGGDYNWERRHQLYETEHSVDIKRLKRMPRAVSQYYVIAFICSLLSCCSIFNSDFDEKGKFFRVAIILILTCLVFWVMKINSIDYLKSRSEMIAKWKIIKEVELKRHKSK